MTDPAIGALFRWFVLFAAVLGQAAALLAAW